MIKAIIFDCFGVLVGEGWKPFRDRHFGISGDDHDWANARMHDVSKGVLSSDEMAQLMEERTGVHRAEYLKELRNTPPNLELLEYIKTLQESYKIGFLSNVGHDRMKELFTPDQIALFDTVVLSYQLNAAKPDAVLYTHTAANLGVETDECIFVDDTLAYCDGAEAVGMKSIPYTDFTDFETKLEELV